MWGSGSGRTTPSAVTRPNRSARYHRHASSRASTRCMCEIDIIATTPRARVMVRASSVAITSGKRPATTAKRRSSTASRAGAITRHAVSIGTGCSSGSSSHGRSTSPRASSSVQVTEPTRTSCRISPSRTSRPSAPASSSALASHVPIGSDRTRAIPCRTARPRARAGTAARSSSSCSKTRTTPSPFDALTATGSKCGMSTIVVTGASAGVGRATARAFGPRGDRVALLARGEDGLNAARREVEEAGGTGLPIPTDVADPDQVEAAAQRVEQELGPIDVWINDAMTTIFAPTWEIAPEEFRRATEVTYLGFVWGTMTALRRMRPRDHGTIVQVGSALAYRGIPLQSAYCGAKHAIEGFTESLRTELLHENSSVAVTMVGPPGLNTPQFEPVRPRLPRHPRPVAPVYQPEIAARAIVWAADHPRREVKVGASTAITIAGNKVLPGVGDWYLARSAVDGQQMKEPVNGDRPDNLFAPVPGDHGAHGRFDDEAKPNSAQLWLTTHKGVLAAGAGIAGAAAAGAVALVRARR